MSLRQTDRGDKMRQVQIKDIVKAVGGKLVWGDENVIVTNVSTDSREVKTGTLFVPIIGERVDAHRFIPDVLEAGASCVFFSDDREKEKKGAGIYVSDTLLAMQKFAAWYRSKLPVRIIGITGSVGKTTTKEMIAAVLEMKYRTVKTYKNLNSQIGVALMMFELDEDTELAVIEMGISMPGEMDRLVEMVKPECAVLTNIGVSHIGNLGSRENICKEKGKIVTYLPDGGTLFASGNGDVRQLVETQVPSTRCKGNCKVSYYGTESGCEYFADEMSANEDGQSFVYHDSEGKEKVLLSVMGTHNVNNAVIAMALGRKYGVPVKDAIQALKNYKPIAMRGVVHDINGIHVVDDTYNASPDSITSNLHALFDYPGEGRRIAVLADVLELGKDSGKLHEGIGQFIIEEQNKGRRLDYLFTVGKEAAHISDYVKAHSDIPVFAAESKDEVMKELEAKLQKEDWVLVKGSRGMKMDEVVKRLIKE